MRPRWAETALHVLLGPLWFLRSAPVSAVLLVFAALLLTLLTQVGGLVLWFALPLLGALRRRLRHRGRILANGAAAGLFLALYLAVSLFLVPPLAALAGRPALPCLAGEAVPLAAQNPLFCLLNRNHARPQVHRFLTGLSTALAAQIPGTRLHYLDAGFPFLDGFPMLPHLSHRYGRDVDLALFWQDRDGGAPRTPPSPLGYWAYAGPEGGESRPCRGVASRLRWDLAWLQPLFRGAALDRARTRAMLLWLRNEAGAQGVRKVLVEPHLLERLAVAPGGVLRFQGCHAARHDDHLHVGLR